MVKILLIEDGQTNRRVAELALQNRKHYVEAYPSWEAAKIALESGSFVYDMVISDNDTSQIPSGKNNEGLERIPGFVKKHPGIPVIFWTDNEVAKAALKTQVPNCPDIYYPDDKLAINLPSLVAGIIAERERAGSGGAAPPALPGDTASSMQYQGALESRATAQSL